MQKLIAVSTLGLLIGTGAALAQTSTSPSTSATKPMQLSSSECEGVWNRADAAKTGSLTQAEAAPYVTDFKAADTSGNGKLTRAEFMAACGKGLVHSSSASTGSSSGSTGSSSSNGSLGTHSSGSSSVPGTTGSSTTK